MIFRNSFTKLTWFGLFAGLGLAMATQAEALPFRNDPGPRAVGGANVVKVDHRHYRERVWKRRHHSRHRHWRRHRGHYRGHHHIHRHGHYGHAAAYDWLAFTAITVKLLDVISESQRQAYASANVRATTAPVGETIYWNREGAQGAITTIRDGTSSAGRYCR
jgi:hypothetical protein